MRQSTSGRLSLAISSLALAVAIGGTGYAAAKIGTKDIKNNAVTSAKVKKDTLTGKDVNEAKLGRVPDAAKVHGMDLARISYRSTSAAPRVIFSGAGLTITASCNAVAHDLTVTATTTKQDSAIYSALTDTDADNVVVTESEESQTFDTTTSYNLLAGATPAQEDSGLLTFSYTALDGSAASGTFSVDAFDMGSACTLGGTVVFG